MPRSTETAATGERVAKLLARAGIASRREVERMIGEGRIARNGVAIDTPATLLTSLDGVTVDGTPVAAPEPTRLFLYHKPVGLLVTEHDPRGRPTIYDRLPRDLPRVVPVGRLDLNTEGLLLLTTDGGFKRQLELPATGVPRTYRARTYGAVTQAQLEALIEGIEIDGMRYGAIDANLERRTGANGWIELTLTEGKNREVRRVLEYLGLEVSRLIRTRYGPFVLGDLPPGEVGEVRAADLAEFRRTLKGGPPAATIAVGPGTGFRSPPTAQCRERSASHPPAPARRPATPPRPPGGPKANERLHQDPVGPQTARRTPRDGTPRQSSPQLDPRARREGNSKPTALSHPTGATRLLPASVGRGKSGEAAKGEGDTIATSAPRPARIQRKAGWAKPKPKGGPARPRKPRA